MSELKQILDAIKEDASSEIQNHKIFNVSEHTKSSINILKMMITDEARLHYGIETIVRYKTKADGNYDLFICYSLISQ